MGSNRGQRLIFKILATGLVLLLSACGGGSDPAAPLQETTPPVVLPVTPPVVLPVVLPVTPPVVPPVVPPMTTLSVSTALLALSVNNTVLNSALSGTPRSITISNTGSSDALAVSFTSAALPAGTTIASTCAGTLAPAANCVLTVTPGAIASGPAGAAAAPIAVNIAGSNTNTVSSAVVVLTYGNVYQSGYVFAIDDSTPNSGSVGGKVAARTDQASIVQWSSTIDDIPGINEYSTTPCRGSADGSCTTDAIVNYYSPPTTTPAVSLTSYAAGLCKATIDSYTDWYLPAICEMGFGVLNCGTQASPTAQNMQSNLVDNGNLGNLLGNHWSSTEYSGVPGTFADAQSFATGGGFQLTATKNSAMAARCVRAITN